MTKCKRSDSFDFSYIGLDVGSKKVGISVLDKISLRAIAFSTEVRLGRKAEHTIIELCLKNTPKALVVGVPLDEYQNVSGEGKQILIFTRRILRRVAVLVEYVDEYDSTEEAFLWLHDGKALSTQDRAYYTSSGLRDSYAAAIILQRYLQSERTGSKEWRYFPKDNALI